ncbi:MAG: hypothetical protein AABW47_00265 [Nanoarchaeota archaeon]
MELDNFKERLCRYKRTDIIFTTHAEIRALGRGIDLEEVKSNILNPTRLVWIEQQKANKPKEEKYGCYFSYSKTYCHKYVLTLNELCVKINYFLYKKKTL